MHWCKLGLFQRRDFCGRTYCYVVVQCRSDESLLSNPTWAVNDEQRLRSECGPSAADLWHPSNLMLHLASSEPFVLLQCSYTTLSCYILSFLMQN